MFGLETGKIVKIREEQKENANVDVLVYVKAKNKV